jgi:hypothetical protein
MPQRHPYELLSQYHNKGRFVQNSQASPIAKKHKTLVVVRCDLPCCPKPEKKIIYFLKKNDTTFQFTPGGART